MTNQYLEINRAKKFQELGIDCGEADGSYWQNHSLAADIYLSEKALYHLDYFVCKTYYLHKLLNKLPEKWFDYLWYSKAIPLKARDEFIKLKLDLEYVCFRGQPALDAVADLIILLKLEGVE